MLKWIGIIILAVILLLILLIIIERINHALKFKIKSKNGIQESIFVTIGGIRQYLQIRGENINNPVILFLHGGPGAPISYISHYYQSGLEADYTFVNWDQRGCGRTYYANPNMDMTADLSVDLLLEDINELIDYLTKRFEKKKIILMGTSWGTVLGSSYSLKYPDKVAAYIGISQVVNTFEGEKYAVNLAMNRAKQAGCESDAQELSKALNSFLSTQSYEQFNSLDYLLMNKLNTKYLSYAGAMPLSRQIWLGISSPFMSLQDFKWFFKSSNPCTTFGLEKTLAEHILYRFRLYELGTQYEVPIFFISGDCDWITPYQMVQKYFNDINAPKKDMIIIKNAGHACFMDNQAEFAGSVKKLLSKIKS